MQRGFRDVFVDALDTAATLAIHERFNERASEHSEGSAELANPATVTQPVNPSQFPSGQPNHAPSGFMPSPVMLAVGGVALLVSGLLIARLLR